MNNIIEKRTVQDTIFQLTKSERNNMYLIKGCQNGKCTYSLLFYSICDSLAKFEFDRIIKNKQ